MSTHLNMRMRNRVVLILLFPITTVLFAIGWIMQQIGQRNYTTKPKTKPAPPKTNGIQIHIATNQEQEETEEYNH